MSFSENRFTGKQGQYLAFIDAYTRVNRRPPAEADIQRYFRVSPPSANQILLTLERPGLIPTQLGYARSIPVPFPTEHLHFLRPAQMVHPEERRVGKGSVST